MKRHHLTVAFPAPCNSLCVRTWELRPGDGKEKRWNIPSRRRWWGRLRGQFKENSVDVMICRGTGGMVFRVRDVRRNRSGEETLRFSDVTPAKVSDSKWDVHSVILNEKCTDNSVWWPGKIHFSFFAIISNNQKTKSREYARLKLYSPSGLFWVFYGNTVVHFWQTIADHQ